MALITRGGKGQKLTIQEMDGNLTYLEQLALSSGVGIQDVTYSELTSLISAEELFPGKYYRITNYRTCYDRPDYKQDRTPVSVSEDSYFSEEIDPLIVLAISDNKLALEAFQPTYPQDTIKYDVSYAQTESGNPAFGRITERVDEWGNRTDYDHRTIKFKRYILRTYNRLNPLVGTVELQSDGTVLGTDTNFNSLSPDTVIAIRNSNETFYKIVSIIDNVTMTVTGSATTATGSGFQFFNTNSHSFDSYYPNNVDGPNDFQLYYTFEAVNDDDCYNTYIGDHAKYFINEGIGDFVLANNVLKDGRYENNTIGDSSYNNTFNDDCTNNQIGFAFRNNITDDDFDENVIGGGFENNIITANFQYNQIGVDFYDNVILCDSFYRNRIGNDFRDNWLDGDWGFDFQNNQIGNQFNNNEIYKGFYKNVILNGYNDNKNWDEFYGNKVGNGFNDNEIYTRFYDNQILDYFNNNIIGDSDFIGNYDFYENIIGNNFKGNTIFGNFYGNHIGHDFVANTTQNDFRDNIIGNNAFSNNIDVNFGYNTIGYGFTNNQIASDFGYGGGQARGNHIGNECSGNQIGEYFYDNYVGDRFQDNSIGDWCVNNKFDGFFNNNMIGSNFRNNDIKVYGFGGTDFLSSQGNIVGFTNNNPNGVDNTYSNILTNSSTSTYGSGATFDITVSGGVVTAVVTNQVGNQYENGDQLTILGSQFGGVDGVDNLIINVNNATRPFLNRATNCTIFLDEDDNQFLSYIDNAGTLQVILP